MRNNKIPQLPQGLKSGRGGGGGLIGTPENRNLHYKMKVQNDVMYPPLPHLFLHQQFLFFAWNPFPLDDLRGVTRGGNWLRVVERMCSPSSQPPHIPKVPSKK